MRRKALWIGVIAVVAGYLAWLLTHSSAGPTEPLPRVPVALSPTIRTSTATPSPETSIASPTPTPAVAPTLLLNAGRVTRRSVVVASGLGFQPKEKLRVSKLNLSGPPTVIATPNADEHGNFSGVVIRVADTWPNGPQRFEVEGLTSHRRAQAQFELEGSPPGAQPTTYSGKPMSLVSFSGGGFAPREQVEVYFDSLDSPVLAHFTADQIGVVHVSGVAVPMSAPGQHAFLLVGRTSRAPVRVPFSVLSLSPWVSLSSYTPQPEQDVGVFGHDFVPGERVAIFLDSIGGRPVALATVDTHGTFQANPAFEIPFDRIGKMTVIAVGTSSQATATTTLTVRPFTPLLELSRYAGPPGTVVHVKGQGFAKDETIHLELGNGQQALSFLAHTDGKGRITAASTIQIPKNMPAGKVPVTAEGEHSRTSTSVTFAVIPLSPWFAPAPAAGPAGTRVTFDGGGFAPDETVQIAIRGPTGTGLAATLTTDDNGAIHHAGQLMIPRALSGTVTLEATGTQSSAHATSTFTIVGSSPARR